MLTTSPGPIRRRVGAVLAVAAVLAGAVAGGLLLTGGPAGERHRAAAAPTEDPPVVRTDPVAAYDAWGAWAVGGTVTIGETDVPRHEPFHLAQTSAGVVVQEGAGARRSRFALIHPDGRTTPLSIPGATPTVDGDISAPRVAWVVTGTDELVLHVWDVARDRELRRVVVPSPGSRPVDGRQFVQPVRLDGDAAHLGTDDGRSLRVQWRTGEVSELPLLPTSVRNGVATALDGTRWVVIDAATGRVRRVLGRGYQAAQLSPDGLWVYLVGDDGRHGFVVRVRGGRPVPLEVVGAMTTWTRGGAVIGQDETSSRLLRCTTDGSCTAREVAPAGDGSPSSILVADFLNVG